jgi:hypothetical protein
MPWWGLLESLLWHLLAVTAVLIFSQTWVSPKPFQARIASPSHISYYTPPPSFPALGSNPSRIRARPAPRKDLAHHPMVSATRKRSRAINPRDIKMAGPGRPGVTSVPPPDPLRSSNARRLQLPAAPPLSSVVGPSPAVSQTMSRRLSLPEGSVVAPPPSVEGVSGRHGIAVASAAVVAPPPMVQTPMRGVGDINIGDSEVVAPAPVLPMRKQRAISGIGQANLGNAGIAVVPPPPSVQRSGILAGARADSLSGTGLQVVPPPPSIQGAGNSAGDRRAGSLPGAGLQVVPPPPSIQGAGNSAGDRRAGSLSGAGLQVVPPPPSVQGADNSAGGGRLSSLSGTGVQVIPPAPSVQGADNSAGGGRLSPLSGAGLQVVPPSPSVQGADNSAGGGRLSPLSGVGSQGVAPTPSAQEGGNAASGRPIATEHPAIAPPKVTENRLGPGTEELSVRLIGLALALPTSSYFTNYEVFIAERRMKHDQSQFIKLVYESLPYQRRLSEYPLNSSRVYKLRVRRDSTCDESLLQMTWPETDPHPGSQYSADSPGLSANDRNSMLPCYRTTADDYRRAFSRGR